MTEWGVVLVIIALAGFIVTVTKPLITLNSTITKLTTVVERLQGDMAALGSKNSESHARIWAHSKAQDLRLEDHEKRISIAERKSPAH